MLLRPIIPRELCLMEPTEELPVTFSPFTKIRILFNMIIGWSKPENQHRMLAGNFVSRCILNTPFHPSTPAVEKQHHKLEEPVP